MAVERIDPNDSGSIDPETIKEHLARYDFAAQFVKNGTACLDCACGTGYGTAMMARSNNARFCGADISSDAIAHAKSHYADPRIEFTQQDATKLDFKFKAFDLIVSFETIEHLERGSAVKLLDKFRDLLKDDGTLILSCPNRDTYSPGYAENQFHKQEYSYDEIRKIVTERFSKVEFYCQQIRYFKRSPKKFANLIKHLPHQIVSYIADIAKKRYLQTGDLKKVGRLLRIFLYERHFGLDIIPYVEDYNAYKPTSFVFVCKK